MLEKLLMIIYLIHIGALFGAIIKDVSLDNLRQEAIELRIKNARLEEQVNELDYKQAELTKKIAEMNGIGG